MHPEVSRMIDPKSEPDFTEPFRLARRVPPGWEPLTPTDERRAFDEVTDTARRRSRVLVEVPCPDCQTRLGWLVVLSDGPSAGEVALELAAPVRQDLVDGLDRPGTWTAFALTGRRQSLKAPSMYVTRLQGNSLIRITCRCGRRQWLSSPILRRMAEAARM